jgi:hypothetical protein
MANDTDRSHDTDRSQLYLVGFRIDPDVSEPQLYTLYVDDDRPIPGAGRPIVFVRPDLADDALQASDCGAAALGPAPSELYAVFDLSGALYTLNEEDEDEGSNLLNRINMILDFCKNVDELMPAAYRSRLESLADHLTFETRFGAFLRENDLSRNEMTDALYWCLGAISYHMKIVT